MITNHNELRNAINSRYKNNREFIEAFEAAGGTIDETVLSRQLNGSRGLSSAWLSAYNVFFNKLNYGKMIIETNYWAPGFAPSEVKASKESPWRGEAMKKDKARIGKIERVKIDGKEVTAKYAGVSDQGYEQYEV